MTRWLAACVVLAACVDPPEEPQVSKVERAVDRSGSAGPRSAAVGRRGVEIAGMPVYHRARRELVGVDGTVRYTTERALDPRLPRTPAVFVDDEAGAIRRALRGKQATRSRARKVWYPYADQLMAAWIVEAYEADGDLVRTVIAADGHVLARDSLVADAFTYTVFADNMGERHPFDSPLVDATPHPTGTPDGSFPGYTSPKAVTIDDGLNQLGDPWLPAGAIDTHGNNVDAYTDAVAPDGLGEGDMRAAAVGSTFPYVYNTADGPLENTNQQMAAVTSLFFVINWLHDFWYDAGFTEVAGNAQDSNYGRGGIEGDVLLAEAQDNALGGSRNNANMATPEDGMSPRMQVFLWRGRDTKTMTLSPSGRTPGIGGAVFGPRSYDVTGNIIVGQDGTGASMTDGCTALTNNVAGKLVLVDRGNCTYKTKSMNAQAANALGVIVANNVATTIPPTLGDDPALADPIIPTVSVTKDEGTTIKGELASAPVSAHITRVVDPDLDGSLDSTLIAHEFGHYIHHRLSVCNNPMCRAMSEGWGDFTALLLLARQNDNLRGAYPFSVYTTQASAGDPGYFGIRRAPYSADFKINALSFRHMANGEPLPTHPMQAMNANAEIHNAGEVWAAALWEAYVSLQETRPITVTFDMMRTRMAHYIVAGLQLAPEEASPLEVRDALLAAVLAENAHDYAVMIQSFARRGFGSCAVAPPPDSIDFKGIVESTLIAGNPRMKTLTIDDGCDGDGVLDSGETATLTLQVMNQGHLPVNELDIAVTSKVPGVTVLTPPVHVARMESFEVRDLQVKVSLEPGLTEAMTSDLALEITSLGGCAPLVSIPLSTRYNIDDVQRASATDTFDTLNSYWEPWAIAWHHVRENALDGYWHGDDLPTLTDVRLTSPRLIADPDKPLTITFSHRFQFEQSDGTNWDGGVIEYSVDEGETWADVADLATPGYTGTITSESGNELGGRMAYAGSNAAWPEYETVTLALGTALGGQNFRLRFRIGSDAATGGAGWDIDDVAFDGIVGTPFPAQVADDGVCKPPAKDDPIIAGGGGCCQTGGPSSGVLALGVLVMLLRRRRVAGAAPERSRSRV